MDTTGKGSSVASLVRFPNSRKKVRIALLKAPGPVVQGGREGGREKEGVERAGEGDCGKVSCSLSWHLV